MQNPHPPGAGDGEVDTEDMLRRQLASEFARFPQQWAQAPAQQQHDGQQQQQQQQQQEGLRYEISHTEMGPPPQPALPLPPPPRQHQSPPAPRPLSTAAAPESYHSAPASSQQQPQSSPQFAIPAAPSSASPVSESGTGSTPKAAPTPRATRRTRTTAASTRSSRRRKVSLATSRDDSDDSASEEFTMEGVKTKSGRKVHRPAHFDPAQKTPSRRRGPYRRNYDARICKVCQRGHSPQSNMIVFCDGCNLPFHQLCHEPPIDDLVVAVESVEWFCAGCAKSRETRPLTMGLSGQFLTEDEKRAYLANLPISSLVELILFAEKRQPDLPLYDPDTKRIVKDIQSRSSPGSSSNPASTRNASHSLPPAAPVDWEDFIINALTALKTPSQPRVIFEWISNNYPAIEGRDVRAEAQSSLQAALRKGKVEREPGGGHLYKVNPVYSAQTTTSQRRGADGVPVPGGGLRLPPEDEDRDMLVDDDLIAFSHRFRDVGIVGGVNGVGAQNAALAIAAQ